jgi:hypothetical protein
MADTRLQAAATAQVDGRVRASAHRATSVMGQIALTHGYTREGRAAAPYELHAIHVPRSDERAAEHWWPTQTVVPTPTGRRYDLIALAHHPGASIGPSDGGLFFIHRCSAARSCFIYTAATVAFMQWYRDSTQASSVQWLSWRSLCTNRGRSNPRRLASIFMPRVCEPSQVAEAWSFFARPLHALSLVSMPVTASALRRPTSCRRDPTPRLGVTRMLPRLRPSGSIARSPYGATAPHMRPLSGSGADRIRLSVPR